MKARSLLLSAASVFAISRSQIIGVVALSSVGFISSVYAASFSSVTVSGNVRVEKNTISDYLGIKPKQSYSAVELDEAVKRLYSTGLFSDVKVNQSGQILTITVVENGVINQVLFKGNKKIKDAALSSRAQLKNGGTLDKALIDQDAEMVRDAYRKIGRADVIVTSKVVDLGEGRMNVVFDIQEGARTKITSINIVGNSAFSDRRLQDIMSTKRSNLFSFITRNDVYDEQRLKFDEETLRDFYFNKGYADFQVTSSSADLNEETNQYAITINVEEGQRYKFGAVSVESTIEGLSSADLTNVIKSKQADFYSAKDVENSLVAISQQVSSKGFPFAQVTPRGDRDFANQTISVIYTIDQGSRAYVERIDVRGNENTRDYVIRREFDLAEGDAFSPVAIENAKRRLEDTGFFERVEITTATGSAADQVVLVVNVLEKSSAGFNIGGGYTSGGNSTGFGVDGSIYDRNFMGRGQFVKLSASGGKTNKNYGLSFTEPYFLGYHMSAGFDIFKNINNYNKGSLTAYDVDKTGATIRFGLPISAQLTGQVAYNYVSQDYQKANSNSFVAPLSNPNLIAAGVPKGEWVKSSISYSLIFDTIDDMNSPHEGVYAKFNQEYAGLSGDANWINSTIKATYYHTLSDELDLVGSLTGGAGYIHSFGDKKAAGSSDKIRVGDLFKSDKEIVRGFKYNGFGPKVDEDFIGGTTYMNASGELEFPLPGIPESAGFKGAVFADAGTLYGSPFEDATKTEAKWRASVGTSLLWASPFGPLRIDYAVPVKKQQGDLIQKFEFGISSKFN
jgi:outer membrane protein insertion porin family